MGYKSNIKFPVIVLKGGTGHSRLVLDLLFPDPPVTFKLVKGNGPIHLFVNLSVGTGEEMANKEDDDEIHEKFEEEKNCVDEKKQLRKNRSVSSPFMLVLVLSLLLTVTQTGGVNDSCDEFNLIKAATKSPQCSYGDVHSLNSQYKDNNDETKILEHQRDDCPLDKDELDRSTWKLLHTIAATYSDEPSHEDQSNCHYLKTIIF